MKKETNTKKEIETIKELESRIAELTAGWQRTQADFNNFRKQSGEERIKLSQNANANLIYELLPILDNFQLAAKHIPADISENNWVQGIRQIEKQLEYSLSSDGLERIEAIGQEFNPMLHEAVEEVSSDKPENEIVEEVLAGYKFNGEILRPAKVKVSKGTAKIEPDQSEDEPSE